jgi:hypothetical protein
VYVYNVGSMQPQEAGTVTFWKAAGSEMFGRDFTSSNVWNADFTGFTTPGTYRLAIEGVGCSEDFEIKGEAYYIPFKVSVKGFFYMRIGQDNMDMVPVPRRPLYIPGQDNVTVLLTTIHPFHADWGSGGDRWDQPDFFANYVQAGNPENPSAWGGHSDALDWDRHLGHVSIIYDMLLPYLITNGAIGDDNLGLAESGNGIPDIIDEAQYEVDLWLRLRDGEGYSHGLSNPSGTTLYQAGPTAMAAWANAANCAMLADCFRIYGDTGLMNQYRDAAIAAYNYAGGLSEQMLDQVQNIGDSHMRGRDFKMMAAAFLYNVTGSSSYEDIINNESSVSDQTSEIIVQGARNQIWGTAAYLFTSQPVNYQTLYNNMKASVIYQARQKEADLSNDRPSRRATDNNTGWFQTLQNVHRTIVAHAISDNDAEKDLLVNALHLEAGWGLGRNPLNIIQMTTATTGLAPKRSVENIYTSGRNDGTPGLHPGHTPYLNIGDWSCNMVMGCPSVLVSYNYPQDNWPFAEHYYNTRYVYAHSEFTPQQSMRGKMALYGYLYGLYAQDSGMVTGVKLLDGNGNHPALPGMSDWNKGKLCSVKVFNIAGKLVFSRDRMKSDDLLHLDLWLDGNGVYLVKVQINKQSITFRYADIKHGLSLKRD